MKRFLSILLVLTMCLTLFAACGKKTVEYNVDAALTALKAQYQKYILDDQTPADFRLVTEVMADSVVYSVVWTSSVESVKVVPVDGEKEVVIDVPKSASELAYVLTATISDPNGKTATFELELVVPANLSGDPVEPVPGQAYLLQMEQNDKKQVLFFNGNPESEDKTYRLATTTNKADAALVYVEAVEGVEGGLRLYFDNNGVKTYLVVKEYQDNNADPGYGKGTLTWETEVPTEYYTYDATAKTLINTDADGEDSYYLGTYSSYTTFSVSNFSYISGNNVSKIDAAQFPARFVTPESVPSHECKYSSKVTEPTCTEAGFTTHTCTICNYTYTDTPTEKLGHNFENKVCTRCSETEHDCVDANGDIICDVEGCGKPVIPAADSTLTVAQAIALAATKDHNTYTEGKYYVTGVITEVYNTTYGNMYIKDENGNTLTIYGTYDATGEVKYDAMGTKPVAGDTITVYGILGTYNDAKQMKNAWITAHTPGEGGGDQPGGEVTPPSATTAEEILNALYALADGESLTGPFTLTGKITTLDNYNNPTIVVEGFENMPVYCYKLVVTQAVGDTITVTAQSMKNYQGTYEFMNCTLVEDSGNDQPGGETPDPQPPVDNVITTIPGALAAADGAAVKITGIVVIAEAWNTQFNNMSVTIKDTEGNRLYVFRLATQVGLGDTITITGVVGSYNDAKQIAAGATATIDVVHGDNHTYENGKCTVCESAQPVAGEETIKCDFSTLTAGTQYANETVSFGDYITVSTHNKGCHFNTQLRIYASDTNNGNAVIASTNVISSLVINAGYKAATLEVYGSVDGTTWVLIENVATTTSYENHTVDVDNAAGYKYIKLDATGAQIRVASIDVTIVK